MYSRCEEVEAAFSQHNLATSVSLWTMDCGLWTVDLYSGGGGEGFRDRDDVVSRNHGTPPVTCGEHQVSMDCVNPSVSSYTSQLEKVVERSIAGTMMT